MSTQAATPEQQTQASPLSDISSPDISFAEYERIRRGGAALESTATSALAAKKPAEQKTSAESDTEETEAKGDVTDGSEEESETEEEAEEPKDAEKEKPKKKGGFQRRIDKLNARIADERQRNSALEERLARIETAGGSKEKVDTNPAAADGKPNPDTFDTHAEYVEALVDWKAEQKLKERDHKLEQSKLEIEQDKVLKSHSERVKAFAEKTKDFGDVLDAVDDIPVSPTVRELIVSSESGPELMYELAKNREEYGRISKLPPLAAAREIGRLESKIVASASEPKPESKKLTKAPKPIQPVGGAASGSVAKSIDDPSITFAEYERLRTQQLKSKR